METDTIIITSSRLNVTAQETVESIKMFLYDHVLAKAQVLKDNPMQLVALPNFKRLIIVCPDVSLARKVMKERLNCKDLEGIRFNYSLANTSVREKKQHLELPLARTLFLVSPPTSPPPEFDYSKLEDGPNMHPGHTTFPALNKEYVTGTEPGHFTVVENKFGKITVDVCGDESEGTNPSVERVKTGRPPRSIFDYDD